MSTTCEKLLRNLNIVKWELKERNDSSLNLCLQYIKDAIYEAEQIKDEIENSKKTYRHFDLDVQDCYD